MPHLWYLIFAVLPAGPSATGPSATGPSATGLLAGAAVALAAVLAVALAARLLRVPRRPGGSHVHATALRERARRTGVLRQCDPDAAGRPRPRAPGRVRAAA